MLKFKKVLALTFLLSSTLFNGFALASEQTLVTINNDQTNNTYQLVIDTTEDNRSIKTFYKDVFLNGVKLSREALDYRVLIRTGMILEQKDQYIIMKLRSENFDEQQGGIISIDTLYNGAKGTRKTYDISLAKVKTGWAIISEGKVVKKIFIQVNKIMVLGTVGIKNLIMK